MEDPYHCGKPIGANLAIYQSGTEVLKKRDIGSKKRGGNFVSLATLAILSHTLCCTSAGNPQS